MGGTCVRDMRIGRVGRIGRDRFTVARRCTDSSAVMRPGTETPADSVAVKAFMADTKVAAASMAEAAAGKAVFRYPF